ncbi:hypothetical protein [Novosphingobium naphthalenivorans]|uniref:hypothetical protein n=1 Tax=Novosphingobium naphthalenivorans TaxID=273168 RepID=UPI000833981E|nr:hypothetical protein [Novosphingobium naphthalenivorans]
MQVKFKMRWLAAIASLAAMATAGQAHAADICGVTGTAMASTGIYYDPFGTSGLNQADIPLTLTRAVGSGGKKTQQVYFILTKPAGSPDYQVAATLPGGTTYYNVLYNEGATNGLPQAQSNVSGQIYYNFGGAAQPDSVTLNIKVTVPAGTDLSAGKPISFGIRYVCDGTGGFQDQKTPIDQANAVTIDVNVLSALRTYYAGTTLDFGEIGAITTSSLATTPQRTAATNYVSVLSSGAYNVQLSSANGFLLKKPGATTADDQVAYALSFLGQTVDRTTAAAGVTVIDKDCQRAGLTSGNQLYIQGALQEGGAGKNPSPTYTDTLTVTVTPLIASNTGTYACGNAP